MECEVQINPTLIPDSQNLISKFYSLIEIIKRNNFPFTEKHLFMGIFFTKFADLQPKQKLRQKCFPVILPKISEHFF